MQRYWGIALHHFADFLHLLYIFTQPWSDGTTGIRISPLELLEKLAALVPLPRLHLVRYGGCLAPHSRLHGAIIPTPLLNELHQPSVRQGVEESTDVDIEHPVHLTLYEPPCVATPCSPGMPSWQGVFRVAEARMGRGGRERPGR